MTDAPTASTTSTLMDFFADNLDNMPSDITTVDMAKAILYMLTSYSIATEDAKAILASCASSYQGVRDAALNAKHTLANDATTQTL
jgi:hypothetical protein